MRTLVALLLLWFAMALAGADETPGDGGYVYDQASGGALSGVLVTYPGGTTHSDAFGHFSVPADLAQFSLRALGYQRLSQSAAPAGARIGLAPFRAKALYLSVYGIGSKVLREQALHLIATTELNALVIDVKGDRGLVPYPSSVALATQVGAQKVITVRDMPALIQSLQAQGVYLIARIVVFKDALLVGLKPQLAVRDAQGRVWRDREGLMWGDPFSREVWQYNIDLAIEAAKLGFDEIQFDYVRFPDAKGLHFAQANTETARVNAITAFLAEARQRLAPYNVFISADIFGYVSWNANDTAIGQQLERLAPVVDILSPMLYPSGFQFGIPGYRNAVAAPYAIVERSLQRAKDRTALDGLHFRPWLPAFRDYGFDRRTFGASQIRAQIDAAEQVGSNGWMLWNPRNQYSAAGLNSEAR